MSNTLLTICKDDWETRTANKKNIFLITGTDKFIFKHSYAEKKQKMYLQREKKKSMWQFNLE